MRTHIHASSGIRIPIPVFERSNTVRALDSAAIGTGYMIDCYVILKTVSAAYEKPRNQYLLVRNYQSFCMVVVDS